MFAADTGSAEVESSAVEVAAVHVESTRAEEVAVVEVEGAATGTGEAAFARAPRTVETTGRGIGEGGMATGEVWSRCSFIQASW